MPISSGVGCAVERRCLPAGANPARQLSLQPVVIGAIVEVTTADSMEVAIRQASTRDLRVIMAKMIEFTANKANHEKNFGPAMDNLVEACRRITRDPV